MPYLFDLPTLIKKLMKCNEGINNSERKIARQHILWKYYDL